MTQSILDQKYFDEVFGFLSEEDTINLEEGLFEKLTKNKLRELDLSPAEIVSINKFISIIDRINNRYPFLYLPYFTKLFMEGAYSSEIVHKFNLWSYGSLGYLGENILKFSGKRSKKDIDNALQNNLDKEGWEKNYNFLNKYSEIFSKELSELLNHNFLIAFIILYIINNGRAKIGEIIQNIQSICSTNYQKIPLLSDNDIKNSFLEYITNDIETKIKTILQNLYLQKYLRYESSDSIELYSKYSNILQTILEMLSHFSNGIPYDNFRKKLLKENTLLKSIPKMGAWEKELDNLEKQGKIVRIRTFWRYSPYRDQLFTTANFEQKREELRMQVAAAGKTAFFGRKITPDQFITELEHLDKGTLSDKDDQVTRLAGMVLASSTLPQSPKEDLDIFDFVTDISNYKFTSQQIQAISKINFQITGKIIHIKVMLNEKVDSNVIDSIKKKLPVGHQAVIFTFKKVADKVIRDLPTDHSIQILGKDAILAWSEITPEIPCRVDSIAKIMFGTLRGKIVKVNAIDYETGFASVLAISENEESTVPVGSLKEIWISNCDLREYNDFAKNYEEFLRILRHCSESQIFDKGLFDTVATNVEYIISYYSFEQPKRTISVKPYEELSLFVSETGVQTGENPSGVEWVFKFDNAQTRITLDIHPSDKVVYRPNKTNYDIRQHFRCSCYYWEGITHSFKFCNHMIAALDIMSRKMNCLNQTWMNPMANAISKLLRKFLTLNSLSAMDSLAFSFSSSKIEDFLLYVKNLPCIDWTPDVHSINGVSLEAFRGKILSEFQGDLQLENLFSKVEDMIRHMEQKSVRVISDEIQDEFDREDWRVRFKDDKKKLARLDM